MDLTFTEPELAFRDELRAWFAAHEPGREPDGDEDAHYQWRVDFQRRSRATAGRPCTGRPSTAGAARP